MKQLRRLNVPTPQDPYLKAQRGALRSMTLSEAEFRTLEKERPNLIVAEQDAMLIGLPHGPNIELHYAFPDRDAFVQHFPDMFQRLVAAVDQEQTPLGFRFRLTERTSRPYLEPVLFAHAFEVIREWMVMELVELPEGVPATDAVAPGYVLRPARPDDAEALAELDAAAFPMPVLSPEVVQDLASQAPALRVLEDVASSRAVGFLRLRHDAPGVGYISDLAIHPDCQRRGLGEATTRWALAWFRQEGLRRAALTVSVDNGPAVALYRKLGFTPQEMGLDYRRPIDEEEVRQVLAKHGATHIRVRKRY